MLHLVKVGCDQGRIQDFKVEVVEFPFFLFPHLFLFFLLLLLYG
jgi:hypothetical protein